MESSHDTEALLGRSYQLAPGRRVRLRLAQTGDAVAIAELLERLGVEADGLELARLVRFDPRWRAVVCATALNGTTETIIALGAIDLDSRRPDTLIVDRDAPAGTAELLARALVGRVRSHAA